MLKKYDLLSIIIMIGIIIICFSMTAYANSSWRWLTTSPLPILPFAIISTLIIETLAVVKFGTVKNSKKAFCIVAFANFLSFLAPYLFRGYRLMPVTSAGQSSLILAFEKGPYFIILTGYLLLTIIVELPVTFFMLKKSAESIKKLAISILVANITTTLMVAVIERIICIGRW